ncbi:PD-(D/E)XK nuclease family protein [Patescibacteria group bacterium]|nr:PD-(D/E)XK nuclease family protein [Patescibacteria group bacterium]MBU4000033.1 PD-(D/E)XK nuclease family protein [Patescibacteria group bacterium]MBU4056618.1 PD-(D/E)XK nuclease family protein [Patescibacteria group bacterium]MBU4368645.1 PD-(D/E)XK nuclease family protein [Patescibacteria group bacterium]
MRISYSALDAFLICPAKYKFSEIDKIKTAKSKSALFGTWIHETLKVLHEPARLTPATEDEVLSFFTKLWDKSVYSSEAEEMAAFGQGIKILKDYYAKNYPANFHIVNLESYFEAPIEDSGEIHTITGKIDRIDKLADGTFEIIDYKTGKTLPPQKDVDKNLQLSVYHLGVVNRWPSLKDKKVKLSLYFVKHGEKLSTTRSASELKETKERILEIVDKIKVSAFAPQPNSLCDWCDFKKLCPYFSHQFKKEAINDAKIKQAVKEYLEIKEKSKKDDARIAELAEIINQYCDEQKLERVFIDEGFISRLLQGRYVYDENKLKDALAEIGKLDKYLTMDLTKIGKDIDSDNFTRDEKRKIESARTKKEFKKLSVKRK